MIASRRTASAMLIALMLVTACGPHGASPGPTAAHPTAGASTAPTAIATALATSPPITLDADFPVANDGRTLHVTCKGVGSPTVVLEAGHPSGGIKQFVVDGSTFLDLLARDRRVCAYNRAGYGSSDPAPAEPRDLDDVTDDLHSLLAAADIRGPLVLAGASFGAFIVTYYAHRFPDGVVGVVLIDGAAPSATLTLEQAPELAWDDPSNPEHVDVVPEFENRLAKMRFPFDAPLLVITATEGGSTVAEQAFWLDWSPSSRQIEIEGEHSMYRDSPGEVADAILSLEP